MAESSLHLSFVGVNHGVTRGGSRSVLLNGKRYIGLPAGLSKFQDDLGNGIFCKAVIAPLFLRVGCTIGAVSSKLRNRPYARWAFCLTAPILKSFTVSIVNT